MSTSECCRQTVLIKSAKKEILYLISVPLYQTKPLHCKRWSSPHYEAVGEVVKVLLRELKVIKSEMKLLFDDNYLLNSTILELRSHLNKVIKPPQKSSWQVSSFALNVVGNSLITSNAIISNS